MGGGSLSICGSWGWGNHLPAWPLLEGLVEGSLDLEALSKCPGCVAPP